MKWSCLCIVAAFGVSLAHAQSEPAVVVDNLALTHEPKGWRVGRSSTEPVHFNLMKGDLIVRIDGRNAAETGPMTMVSLFNQGDRRQINLFIERGDLRMETPLRQISKMDFDPIGANPFRRVATGFSAPSVDFKDIDGKPVTLEQFRGKWVLIDFMATWCPPCIRSLPNVLSIAGHTSQSLDLLTVALNDKADAVRRMQRDYKIDSTIAMVQTQSELPIDFGITTSRWTWQVPALVLIRPDGDVALIDLGCIDTCHVDQTIESMMELKADDVPK